MERVPDGNERHGCFNEFGDVSDEDDLDRPEHNNPLFRESETSELSVRSGNWWDDLSTISFNQWAINGEEGEEEERDLDDDDDEYPDHQESEPNNTEPVSDTEQNVGGADGEETETPCEGNGHEPPGSSQDHLGQTTACGASTTNQTPTNKMERE